MIWLVAAAALAAAIFVVNRLLSGRERRLHPPRGRHVDVDGRKVHVLESGRGGPTVVLDSALAATSLSWYAVQPEIARFARVTSYDRLGFGWSDSAPTPRTVSNMTDELRRVLRASGAEPPYVLVGHSYGGWIAELFTTRHRDEVAGLVLVDVPHPREWADPDDVRRERALRGARHARLAATTARLGLFRVFLRVVTALGGRRESQENTGLGSLIDRTPEEVRAPLRSFWVRARTLDALASQIENAVESAATVSRERRTLGSLPLVTLTAAEPTPERLEAQRETAALSSRSEHVVAKTSGHWIPLEEPALVVAAVRRVLALAEQQADEGEVADDEDRALDPAELS